MTHRGWSTPRSGGCDAAAPSALSPPPRTAVPPRHLWLAWLSGTASARERLLARASRAAWIAVRPWPARPYGDHGSAARTATLVPEGIHRGSPGHTWRNDDRRPGQAASRRAGGRRLGRRRR